MIQGSPEWFAARLGKVTASRISDIVGKTKNGYGASRANYMAQLIAERLTGQVQESYTNAAMQWGVDMEPEARAAYEFRTDCDVELVSFIEHLIIPMSGASPDGFIGDAGLVEIKCPNTATHIDTLLGATTPLKYFHQIQWQLACTGRGWCDFVSYDPRMLESMRMFVSRVKRDDGLIEILEKEVSTFLGEIDNKIAELRKLYEMGGG